MVSLPSTVRGVASLQGLPLPIFTGISRGGLEETPNSSYARLHDITAREPSMNARLNSVAAKSITPRFWAALALSVLPWLGGLHGAEAGVDVWTSNGPPGGFVFALAIDPQTPTTLYVTV